MSEYLLYYWPGLPGRGEFVRLVLAEGAAEWTDVELEGPPEDAPQLRDVLQDASLHHAPFAPPFLQHGKALIAQTPLICDYLGQRLDLTPDYEAERRFALQCALTIADLTAEAHDVHHPVSAMLHYEDQKDAAREAARVFREQRIPKFLAWFEQVLANNSHGAGQLAGDRLSHADIALAHCVDGLCYAFPRAMESALKAHDRVANLRRAVMERPRIADYLASGRRQAFNTDGVFRYYPELDAAA
ncbi:MAG: glutathione S-transferase family protein [Oceanicaulis sp.]